MAMRPAGALPLVMTVIMTATCLALGTWQVQRMGWKRALIAERAAALAEEPAPLPIGRIDPDAAPRRYVAEGHFRHDRELHVFASRLNAPPGEATSPGGFHVLTVFALGDGRKILVLRGWVPTNRRDPSTRPEGQIRGPMTLTGIGYRPEAPGGFVPEYDPANATWYAIDLPKMEQALGSPLMPIVLVAEATPPNPGGYPIGGQFRSEFPDNHLAYVVTWYGLAASAIVIFVVYRRRRDGSEA